MKVNLGTVEFNEAERAGVARAMAAEGTPAKVKNSAGRDECRYWAYGELQKALDALPK
jgi:hypothetical protein